MPSAQNPPCLALAGQRGIEGMVRGVRLFPKIDNSCSGQYKGSAKQDAWPGYVAKEEIVDDLKRNEE